MGAALLVAGALGLALGDREPVQPEPAAIVEPARDGEAGRASASGTINAAVGGVVAVRDLMEDRASSPAVRVGAGPLRVLVEAEQAAGLSVRLSLGSAVLALEGEPPLSAMWEAGPGSVRVDVAPSWGSVHAMNGWTVSLAWDSS